VSGSSVGFFIRGRTRACFSCDAKMPDCRNRLHRWQMTGVTCGDKRFSSQVGMGIQYAGLRRWVARSRVAKSCSDTGSNDDNGGTCLSVRTGGGAAAVASWILLTLSWRKMSEIGSSKLRWTFAGTAAIASGTADADYCLNFLHFAF